MIKPVSSVGLFYTWKIQSSDQIYYACYFLYFSFKCLSGKDIVPYDIKVDSCSSEHIKAEIIETINSSEACSNSLKNIKGNKF